MLHLWYASNKDRKCNTTNSDGSLSPFFKENMNCSRWNSNPSHCIFYTSALHTTAYLKSQGRKGVVYWCRNYALHSWNHLQVGLLSSYMYNQPDLWPTELSCSLQEFSIVQWLLYIDLTGTIHTNVCTLTLLCSGLLSAIQHSSPSNTYQQLIYEFLLYKGTMDMVTPLCSSLEGKVSTSHECGVVCPH